MIGWFVSERFVIRIFQRQVKRYQLLTAGHFWQARWF
jgi:hypothetical protein